MHNVRAYTFWFLQFCISAYTTLNELLAVFLYIIFAVGVYWLRKREHYVWDFDNYRIKFSDEGWIDLRREDSTHIVRQVYASKDTSLSPAQQTNVDVRIMHEKIRSKPFVGLMEAEAVPNLRHVYSARSLIPAMFSGIKVPFVNTKKKSQILRKRT